MPNSGKAPGDMSMEKNELFRAPVERVHFGWLIVGALIAAWFVGNGLVDTVVDIVEGPKPGGMSYGLASVVGIRRSVVALAAAIGLLLFCGFSPWRSFIGLGRPKILRFTQATLIAFLVWCASSMLPGLFARDVSTPGGDAIGNELADLPPGLLVLHIVRTSVVEEAQYIAVPLLALSVALGVIARSSKGEFVVPVRMMQLLAVGALLLAVIDRAATHVYQGGGAVALSHHVVLGLGVIVIFCIFRSIWPIIAAHFAYDMAATWGLFENDGLLALALIAVTFTLVFLDYWAVRRKKLASAV